MSEAAHAIDWDDDRRAVLEAEIAALTAAAREQEKLVLAGYREMDELLRSVEAQRNELAGTNSALTQARGHLDRVVDTMGESLIVVDATGAISLVNGQLVARSGYSREALLGADASLLFDPDELASLGAEHGELSGQALVRVMSRHRGRELDGHLVGRDGKRLPHLFRWANLYSPEGKKEGLVVIGADVTQLRSMLEAIQAAEREMRLVLNNVEQGLLTFNMEGVVAGGRSACVEEWFGPVAEGVVVWDYLGAKDPSFGVRYAFGWEAVVEDILPLEVNIHQLPKEVSHEGRVFEVVTQPVHHHDEMMGALLVITDVTERRRTAAEQAARSELLDVLNHVGRDRRGFVEFYEEANTMVASLVRSQTVPPPQEVAVGLRQLHTIKGNASLFGAKSIESVCHRLEDTLKDEARFLSREERQELRQTWSGFTGRVNRILGGERSGVELDRADYDAMVDAIQRGVDHHELLAMIRRMTIEPSERRFERLVSQAQGLAKRLGKPAPTSEIHCAPVRFPPEPWSAFWSAFAHALRNAVDHGIESPEVREAAGKPAAGHLTFRTRVEGDEVWIQMSDDGGGIDWEAVRAKAKKNGLPHESQADLELALTSDGFSTRSEASMMSGRGVGMGALRQACEELGGSIRIDSTPGVGTTFTFALPLSLVV